MASFTFARHVAAPPETVFEVLTDLERYSEFTPLRGSTLERRGESEPNGVGAIRVLTSLGPPLREEVIAYQPPNRFAYKLLSGAPLRDHVGTVELSAEDGGTRMVYAIRTVPTLPLVGPVVIAVAKQAVGSLVKGVAKESERRAANAAR
jgi:uncharacterized protein YndB with AHSA1/START domain